MARILIDNVTKAFGTVKAVDSLQLEIPDGSFTTLLGPSGCGKTTTLRMIAGLETPTEKGEIWIGDTCVYSAKSGAYVPPAKRRLGLVFQSYALWPHMTVFENIAFGLRIERLSNSVVADRVTKIAKTLFIEDLLQRYPSEISGGQQQRVAIARVLVVEPRVLLLDEPLSNLDAKLRMDMRAELKRLHAETGSTIVYVTHDQLEALTMSTDVAVMNLGKLQQWDNPTRVYNNPANLFTADFIGNPRINSIKGTVHRDSLGPRIVGASLSIPIDAQSAAAALVDQPITIGLRAEDLELSPTPRDGFAAATVYSVLPAGAEWYVRIKMGEQLLTVTVYHELDVRIDTPIWVGVKPGRVKCFDAAGNRVETTAGA